MYKNSITVYQYAYYLNILRYWLQSPNSVLMYLKSRNSIRHGNENSFNNFFFKVSRK